MRLGGPVFGKPADPGAWVEAVRSKGVPRGLRPRCARERNEETVRAYRRAAEAADIVIAEVGAWSNPLSSDPVERERALGHCKAALKLARAAWRPLLREHRRVPRLTLVRTGPQEPHQRDVRHDRSERPPRSWTR